MIVVLAVILLLLILGAPLAVALLLASMYGLEVLDLPHHIVAQRFFFQLTGNGFLAIPFFVLVGELMVRTSMGTTLMAVAKALVGHRRGGLAQSSVLLGVVFSGVSGSATADAAFASKVLVPEMKQEGYSGPWSAALVAAGASLGPIIPPSVTAVIYASIAGIAVGPLLVAGAIPGLLIAGAFALTVHLQIRKRFEKKPWVGPRVLARAIFRALPALIAPIIIVGGLLGGVFTATESGAVAAAYVVVANVVVYRSLSLKEFFGALEDTAIVSATVMLIIATAGLLSWLLGVMGIHRTISSWMVGLPSATWMLVISLAIVIFLGCFMESMAVGILLIPLLHPIAVGLGFDPMYFGFMIVLAIVLGAITPPFGLVLFLVATATKEPLAQIYREIVPFLVAFIVVLVLCVAFPWIVTWLPDLAFGE